MLEVYAEKLKKNACIESSGYGVVVMFEWKDFVATNLCIKGFYVPSSPHHVVGVQEWKLR